MGKIKSRGTEAWEKYNTRVLRYGGNTIHGYEGMEERQSRGTEL